MNSQDSVRTIKGIGEKAEHCLNKMKIETVGDLLEHYPRNYDEWKPIVPIHEVTEGEMVALEGSLMGRPQLKKHGSRKILSIVLQDETGNIPVTWYNMPFLMNQLKMGTRYILRGKVGRKYDRLVLEQPAILKREEFYRQVGTLRPIYPLTSGITNNALIKAQQEVLKEAEFIKEFLPSEIRKRQHLLEYKQAIRKIHFPANKEEAKEARRRLAFDELFLYCLALSYMKRNEKQASSYVMKQHEELSLLEESLPFDLTDSQNSVWNELESDMTSGYRMNRLLQGDVGSGKTIVAIKALYMAYLNGWQGAFMVPTEVLATQHKKELTRLLEPLGVRVELLSGSQKASEKRAIKEALKNGDVDIVVGTHAVIQEDVEFASLALVITDEQHRFGVRQREALFRKGKEPHVLAMSATPIPRTLALILYGDMDLSLMEKPPANRLPIKNCVVNTAYRPNAYRFMMEQIKENHQIYVICPMVDEGENADLENVTLYTENLREVFPPGVVIEGLHGKMKPAEKDRIMERYVEGEIQILVSTTVIEVGIDVPNATVMMIENAERFGLAQLHQLRGRVGRGAAQSYCILMTGKDSKESRQRLEILANSNDGFYIAREDLKLRGQGDLFGVRQSGDQIFELADIFEDSDLLMEAMQEVKKLTKDEITMLYKKNERLKNRIEDYLGQVTL
ncbi:MAG: ATP-dependent DNA helicase RecG [Eubacterium sp.]|nr:ATP-dependent DNA helicase RecG [Eubacterium sp.]